jgi:pyruvate carboxylase
MLNVYKSTFGSHNGFLFFSAPAPLLGSCACQRYLVQVEHTVTENVTGIDIVQSQILIASGMSLEELGLTQDTILPPTGVAMQCRVTTEDPSQDFRPDTGTISVFRAPGGFGIRLDEGPGFNGAHITPHYDSLLVKITAHARTHKDAARKLTRAIREFRVRGVKTNKSFLLNVLSHPDFLEGVVDTGFIAENPHLLDPLREQDRAQKVLRYLADVIVNGTPKELGAIGPPPSMIDPMIPTVTPNTGQMVGPSLKQIFDQEGPEAFARAVRNRQGLLVTDTTWRDAHQSLLATRVRTIDLLNIAPATSVALSNAYSLECWGGATFDVALRFLREDPWDRLAAIREAVPDIPTQMLLRVCDKKIEQAARAIYSVLLPSSFFSTGCQCGRIHFVCDYMTEWIQKDETPFFSLSFLSSQIPGQCCIRIL